MLTRCKNYTFLLNIWLHLTFLDSSNDISDIMHIMVLLSVAFLAVMLSCHVVLSCCEAGMRLQKCPEL